jgi:phage recombination protein Bet
METNKMKRIELIKNKCCQGFAQHEIDHFLYVVEKTKLDPLMNQIYVMKMGGKLSIQTSIDGLRLLAERGGNYSPGEDVHYEYSNDGQIVYAKCTVKKRTDDGAWHNITARAYWKEFAKEGNGGRFWKQLPHLMIAKCAEALALRKAFPQDLSGLYIKEEMDQASKNIAEYIKEEQVNKIKEMTAALSIEKYNELLKVLNLKDFSKIPKDKYEKAIKFIQNYINRHICGEKEGETK